MRMSSDFLYSLRISLDVLISSNEEDRTRILENIRYCRRIIGSRFQVIFWNNEVSEKDVRKFVADSDGLLFEVNTKITKKIQACWFLINTTGKDYSRHRYEYPGDILEGIVHYMELAKHVKQKENDENSNRG